jgi:hypothetical protein
MNKILFSSIGFILVTMAACKPVQNQGGVASAQKSAGGKTFCEYWVSNGLEIPVWSGNSPQSKIIGYVGSRVELARFRNKDLSWQSSGAGRLWVKVDSPASTFHDKWVHVESKDVQCVSAPKPGETRQPGQSKCGRDEYGRLLCIEPDGKTVIR